MLTLPPPVRHRARRARALPLAISRALSLALVLGLGACTIVDVPEVEVPETVVVDLQPSTETPEPVEEVVDPNSPEAIRVRVEEDVAQMDLRSKLAGLMMVTIKGMSPEEHQEFLERIPVAGFLLSSSNLEGGAAPTRAFVTKLQDDQLVPLLIAVDQEGGPVTRIRGDDKPGAQVLGQGGVEETEQAFRSRQELVLSAGVNVNFGVVADVSGGRSTYIHERSFSTEPSVVADHVLAALGPDIPGVAQTLKHFPGHGMVAEDTHTVVPSAAVDKASWWDTHALPFVAGVDAGADMVMSAHIRVPSVSKDPASLSDDWVAILRDEMGFQGIIVTDDLAMLQNSGEEKYQDPAATMVAALVAGNDLLLLTANPAGDPNYEIYDRALDALVASVEAGNPSVEHVDASLVRVLTLRWSLGRP